MMKRLIYLILFFAVLSCEDVYVTNLDQSENMIVIEAKVTNTPDENLIRISKTLNFYEEGVAEGISGAEIFLVDDADLEVKATDSGNGNYLLNYSAEPGKQYKLKIKIGAKEYESDFELMPSLPQIEEFNVKIDTVETYSYSSKGEPMRRDLTGAKATVGLSIDNELSHYYFKRTMVLEYIINFEATMIPPPPIYGWQTYSNNSFFNIAGPPEFGDVEFINGHEIAFNSSKLSTYLNTDIMSMGTGVTMTGWILILDQFGTSEKTFNFYKTLNAQLEAEGKLFDPVFPQINSNIRSTTDPNEKIIGYFELSSHRHTRYFYSSSIRKQINWYEFDEVFSIPFSGQVQQDDPPVWWERYGKRPYGPLSNQNN